MRDFIRVETPFDVDRFEAMLYDHPNQPFVKSVMDSLRYGFWTFDKGNWKDDHNDIIPNYSSKDINIQAIRAFRDDKIQARWWSDLNAGVIRDLEWLLEVFPKAIGVHFVDG